MEVLAAATTVTAVLDASWRVIKYINSAKGATQERKKLREELRACESVLQQLKDEVDDSEEGQAWTETLRALEAPGAPLGRLLVTLGEVEAKLQPQEGRRKLLTSMRWPFNEKELKEIFSMIEREKALLMLAISNNTRLLVQRINATAEESNEQLRRLLVTIERDSDQTRQAQDILKDGVATIQKTQVQIGENIDNLSRRHAEQESAEQRTRVLSWLSDIDYAGHHKDLIANRHEGTGSWLVESPIFKEWFESPAADELFCPGMPGAGKTILSSVVIDWLLSQSQNQRHLGTQRVGVAYMYCNFRRPEEQVVRRVLASLLKQLGQNWDVLPDQIRALYNTCYGRGVDPSVGQLLTTIRSVGTLYSSVYIIIDALDEAKEEDGFRQQLISSLYAIQLDEKSKLFLTSRFNSDVIGMLKKSRTIEIRASDEDVKTYLNAQMPRLPAFVSRSTDLQAEVEAGISKVVDGMFLLAKLYLDSLCGKRSPKALRTALQNLYTGSGAYDRAYDDAMARIESQSPDREELGKQVLAWVVRAATEIKPVELQHALAVELGETDLDEENIPEIDDMLSACAGLVTTDAASNTVRLVHYTTQEYFTKTWKKWFPTADEDITKICVTYLGFERLRKGRLESRRARWRRTREHPLYNYSATYWGHHAHMLGRPCQEVIDFLETPTAVVIAGEIVFSDDVSRLVERLFSFWAESEKGNAKRILGLHLACHFGIKYAVEHLLAIGHEPDTPNPYGRTPLSLAAAHGYDEIILLLLETGEVDADTRDTDGHSPLSWAARKRHLSTVKLLLGIDADDATQRLFDFTWKKRAERERALQSAHSDRAPEHEPSRPNRLSSAVDDDSKAEGTRWSPLFEAVHGGDAEIVKIFLARGVSVAAEEHRGRLPLHIAASMGHIIVTKLLLDAGSDAEHRDEDGRTPLSIAVASSRAEIVQVLLQAHVDVDAKDKEGKTPLHSHPDNGLGAFTALLDHGAKVDIKDHKSRTALHAQVKQLANEPLAELLLEHGADVDAADAKGMTALGRARSGRAVEVLLAHGADTKVRDKAGRTVLCQGKKSADAVKMLLGRGLAFDARCDAGRAPLSHVAGTAVDPACVTALIEAGASVDETDYKGRTPLWHSANLGGQRRVDVAKELLARGASVDHLDVDGVSALRAAVSNNLPAKEEMVKLLVEAGASYDGFEDHERKYIDDALSNSLWVPAPKVDEEDEDVDHPQCPLQ